jgi:hypothetical protein
VLLGRFSQDPSTMTDSMKADELEGRIVALEVISFGVLTALMADWRAGRVPIEERIGYLDGMRDNVKTRAQMAKLNPRAAYEAIEFADRFLAELSEHHANLDVAR